MLQLQAQAYKGKQDALKSGYDIAIQFKNDIANGLVVPGDASCVWPLR